MALTKLFVYHVASGRILASADYDEATDGGPAGARAAALGLVDPSTHYAPAGVITARPANATGLDKTSVVADELDVATLTGVPNPSVVTVRAITELQVPASVDVTDGTLALTFNRTGSYEVSVQSFPAQDAKFHLTAVAP
jgi:hypothetical protein